MKNNEKDIFEVNIRAKNVNNNFFLSEEKSSNIFDTQNISEPIRRLNDYDFNLLKEDAYKDISDDLFKLEYKIARTEEEIKLINAQIDTATEIQDYVLIEELKERKSNLEEDLEALVALYNDKSLSAKISDKIMGIFGGKLKSNVSNFQKKVAGLSEIIVSKMPKQFSSVIELKKSLLKLENINKSVDELMGMNIPYGENYNKYEQLSKYIIKANSIQAEISKYMSK